MPEPARTGDAGITSPYRLTPTTKRVRARLGGTFVADSTNARLFSDAPYPRAYAFPRADVQEDLLGPPTRVEDGPFGPVASHDVRVGDRSVARAVHHHPEPRGDPALADLLVFDWDKMDAWYEEDEEVFVHPHDPYHRIDVRKGSRHIIIERDGTRLAESHRPTVLFETGLPVRYYLPQTDVRLDRLRPSTKTTGCAYKGFADYFHAETAKGLAEDIAWTYRSPHLDAYPVQGLVAFFDERVDVIVDGERQARPETPWS